MGGKLGADLGGPLASDNIHAAAILVPQYEVACAHLWVLNHNWSLTMMGPFDHDGVVPVIRPSGSAGASQGVLLARVEHVKA